MDPARHVFQEKPDFKECVRRLINVQLKDIIYLMFFMLITNCAFFYLNEFFLNLSTNKELLFLINLSIVLGIFFARYFLWLIINSWSYNLNFRVGTLLKEFVDND